MIKLQTIQDYSAVVLEEEDFPLFVEAFTACLLEKSMDDPEHVEDLEDKQARARKKPEEYWREKLSSSNTVNLVVLGPEKDSHSREIIGVAQAAIDNNIAVLGELHILKEHRKSGLKGGKALKCLMEGLENYLEYDKSIQMVFAQIDDNNVASQKLAAKAGLQAMPQGTGDASKFFGASINRSERKPRLEAPTL